MKKDENKTSRAAVTRSKTERPKEYKPPSSLDAPPAPDGFRHRWIRAESMGFNDTKNIHGRLRSGYELVRADEYDSEEYPVVHRRKIRWSDWSRWPSPGKDTRRTRAVSYGLSAKDKLKVKTKQ